MEFVQDFLLEMALPFILVFVLTFAILEKTKILGDKKHQINSILSLVIAALLISFPKPRDFIVNIMPWLGVGLAILFIFFVLYGFVVGDIEKNTPKPLKIALGILVGLFVIGVVLFSTGLNTQISGWFGSLATKGVFGTGLVVLVVVGLIIWIIASEK